MAENGHVSKGSGYGQRIGCRGYVVGGSSNEKINHPIGLFIFWIGFVFSKKIEK